MTTNIPIVIVANNSAAIGFALSLKKNNIPVYYLTNQKNEATFSRHFKKSIIIPNIENNIQIQTDFLTKFAKKHPFSVIVPGSDFSCLTLVSTKKRLSKNTLQKYHFLLPQNEALKTLINKRNFYQSLIKHNIPHPKTYFPENLNDVEKIASKIDYPVYIKPYYSHISVARLNSKGSEAKTKEDLKHLYNLYFKNNIQVLIQECVPGPDNHLFGINAYFNKKCNPQGLFAYQWIRAWPKNLGYGVLIESVPLSKIPLQETAIKYLQSIEYHGLADMEFKKDPRDQEFKFLEVNPRVWYQNSFPAKCGINLNLIAYLDATNKKAHLNYNYKTGKKWASLTGNLFYTLQLLKNKENITNNWIGLHKIREWDYSPLDDFIPWITHIAFIIQHQFKKTPNPLLTQIEPKKIFKKTNKDNIQKLI